MIESTPINRRGAVDAVTEIIESRDPALPRPLVREVVGVMVDAFNVYTESDGHLTLVSKVRFSPKSRVAEILERSRLAAPILRRLRRRS